jgi:competence protein ComEA
MRISSALPASLARRLGTSRRWIVRVLSRLPALAPAEKGALLAILAVLAAGGLLRAWEHSGVNLGPVDDWKTLRELIVDAREDFARRGGGNAGGYPCAIDELPGNSAGLSEGENILAAGMGSFGSRGAKAPGKSGSGKKAPPARPVDLNTAGEKALLSLPGVGPSTAKAILAYRAAQGKFRSVDDLMQVKGIGPKKMEALRPYARVAAPADTSGSATPP